MVFRRRASTSVGACYLINSNRPSCPPSCRMTPLSVDVVVGCQECCRNRPFTPPGCASPEHLRRPAYLVTLGTEELIILVNTPFGSIRIVMSMQLMVIMGQPSMLEFLWHISYYLLLKLSPGSAVAKKDDAISTSRCRSSCFWFSANAIIWSVSRCQKCSALRPYSFDDV